MSDLRRGGFGRRGMADPGPFTSHDDIGSTRGFHIFGEFLPGCADLAGDGRIGDVTADRSGKPEATITRKKRRARWTGGQRPISTWAVDESDDGFTAVRAGCKQILNRRQRGVARWPFGGSDDLISLVHGTRRLKPWFLIRPPHCQAPGIPVTTDPGGPMKFPGFSR